MPVILMYIRVGKSRVDISMKTATLLFTYNRSGHTEQVLTSLKNNSVLPQKLIIFQDGMKADQKDFKEWKKVNTIIHNVDWCDKEIITSETNKGLAKSIVYGINFAFSRYDTVIVLEDDCVAAPDFIKFMEQCFLKYENDKSIYCVSGYSWPVPVQKDSYDIYGCGRISSWGWGTWKDRWKSYCIDHGIVKRLEQDQMKSLSLSTWGNDCKEMLIGNVEGRNDSWAVYWALNVMENGGICINPYRSLIKNIGLDGTGVHCGITDRFQTEIFAEGKTVFELPDKVEVYNSTKMAFADLYGNYTAVNLEDDSKEKVLVYGLGNFFKQHEKEINESYYIEAFIDQKKQGWYAGKKIMRVQDAVLYQYDKILVMIRDIQECINVSKNLVLKGVPADKILLGNSLYEYYSECIDQLSVLEDGNFQITVGEISLKVRSKDEFNNVHEVLVEEIYDYFINNDKQDVVLDVGMNIGDAALYFLHNKKVKKVYAYEPFMETYLTAKDNLQEFQDNTERMELFQYGLSNENTTRTIGFNSNMTCGQSTIAGTRDKVYDMYRSWGLVDPANDRQELVEVRDAAEEISCIVKKHPKQNIVLKMDCEGEEYGIIEELSDAGVLEKISFIMLEWHYAGKESLIHNLKKAGFSYWCNDKNNDMGMIYAYKTVC